MPSYEMVKVRNVRHSA